MRRLLATLLLCTATMITAGCGGGPGPGQHVPTVTGGFGTDPKITLPSGRPPGGLVVQTLGSGSGPVLKPTDFMMVNVEAKVWSGDRMVVDSFLNHQPQGLPVSAGLPAWRRLAGQRVGSRVLEVVPPKDGFGSRGNASINVTGSDTLVFVFDILAAVPANGQASGTVVPYHPAPGMPRVRASAHGPVIIVPPHQKPPKDLVTRVLIRGNGPVVTKGDSVVVQYTGTVWRTGKIFNTSRLQGRPQAFALGTGQVIPGWDRGLIGQHTGSRVLLVIPPSLGYGKSGNPPLVRGTDTVVYVVDVLAVFHH